MCGVLRRIHMTTGRNAFTLTTGKLFARRSLSFRSRSFPSFCPISFMCCTSLSLNSCNSNNQIILMDYLNYQHVSCTTHKILQISINPFQISTGKCTSSYLYLQFWQITLPLIHHHTLQLLRNTQNYHITEYAHFVMFICKGPDCNTEAHVPQFFIVLTLWYHL